MKTPHFSIRDFHWRDQGDKAAQNAVQILNTLNKQQADAVKLLKLSSFKEGEDSGREDMQAMYND